MRRQHFVFLIRHAPLYSYAAEAGLDVLLTAAAFEQETTLVFYGDGVFHLLEGQHEIHRNMKNISRALPALHLYDVDRILVDEASLQARKLEKEQLLMPLETLDEDKLSTLLDGADRVFNF